MLKIYIDREKPAFFIGFFFALLLTGAAYGQIYLHDFGATTINTHPYTASPSTSDINISGSSWTNSTGSWSSNTGSSGQAIQMFPPAGTSSITLTFTVAESFEADIASFSFYSRRSASGPQNWQLTINGIDAGSGTISVAGASTGNIPVANPVTGLTGTITVVLTLTNGSGGNIRFDDFALFGSVTSNCGSTITSFSPASGPQGTVVTITGSGLAGATGVKFNNIASPSFTVISDTEIEAEVPPGNTGGDIVVTAGCQAYSPAPFELLSSECMSGGSEIYISELHDAQSGSPGLIELYNPSSATIVFGGQYVLERYGTIGDSSPTPGYVLTLPGSIGPGETYLINTGPTPCGVIPAASIGSGINNNDEFKLKKNGTLIDVARAPGEVGYTVIRKPDAVAPAQVYNSADWIFNGNESCGDIGTHTVAPTSPPPITSPTDKAVCENGSTTFTAGVNPATGATYQWKMLNNAGVWVNVANGVNYSGATTATLTISGITAAFNENQYYCQMSVTTCSNVVSGAAQLTVSPAADAPVATVQQPGCTGPATGTITITAPVGAGYTYSINGSPYQAGTSYPFLPPGDYTITAKEASGCISETATYTINTSSTPPEAATANVTHPTCTVTTGTITITAPFGAGLTYSLDGGPYQAGTTFNGVASGSHTITVQNADGCTSAPANVTVNPAPAAPAAATASVTHPTCTTSTGSITITSPLSVGLTYSLDGGQYQAGTIFNGVASGSHTITVQNADGCTSAPANVTVNPAPVTPASATASVTHPTCTVTTGSITITSPLGAGLTYSLDGGPYQAGTTFSNVTPGNHTITVQNTEGCTSAPANVTVNPAPAAPAAATANVTHPTCTVTTGSITITAPLGAGLTYSLDGEPYQAGTTFNNVASGNHSITVQNADGCTSAPANITVNPAPTAPAAATASVTHPTCTTSTGSITITAPLGAGLTYSLDGGAYQASATFNNVSVGNHTITVQNTDGCTSAPANVTVNPAPAAPAAATTGVTQPTCTTSTGSITITAPLGAGLTYSLDGGPYQAGTTFNNVTPGNHTITVQNADGCTSAPANVAVNSAPTAPAAATANVTHPTCTTSTGSITITAPLGAGLTYSLDGEPYQVGTTFNNITPGNHTITVQNADDCTSAPANVTVNPAPAAPASATASVTHPDCTTTTGTITVTNPLSAGLVYNINGGTYQASPTFSSLAPGTYTIRVQNAGGCTSAPVNVIIAPVPTVPAIATFNVIQPDCDTATGSILITSPLNPGLTYSINGTDFQNSNTFNGVTPGTYTVTVQNTAGCTSVSTAITIDNPPAQAPDPGVITGTAGICLGNTTQLANAVTGGTWSSSNESVATIDANGLVTSISYGLTVIRYTVGTGCTNSAELPLRVYPLPEPRLTDTYICKDIVTGQTDSAVLNTGLSSSAHSFAWTKGGTALTETGSAITVNEPGVYTVIATNLATGCTSEPVSATVSVSSIAVATAEVKSDFDFRQTITVNITGGSGDYEYSLDGGPFQPEPVFTGIYEGEHTIIVNDINGCGSTTLTVFALNYPRFFSPNGDAYNEAWNIDGLRDQREAMIYIFDRYGKVIASVKPSGPGWDGTYNGRLLPATDYWFTVSYRSSDGKVKEFKSHFSLIR